MLGNRLQVFKIRVARHKGKRVEVTRYLKTASGVEIQVKYNVPSTVGKQLRWVQTVSENGSFYKDCEMRTYGYTDAELAAGRGLGFYDKPSESKPASGRTWIKFILALTEVRGKKRTSSSCDRRGFDRLANGTVLVAPVRMPTIVEMGVHGQAPKRMYSSYRFT